MDRLSKILDRIPIINDALEWTRNNSFPGFGGIPLYDVGSFFITEIRRDRLTVRAAAMAFNFVLAIFPSILFLFTLIPYIPIHDLDTNILKLLRDVLPLEAFIFIQDTVEDIVSRQRGDLLSVGFILAFYFATNGVNSMVSAFNKKQPTFKRRSFIQNIGNSFKLTFYLFTLFIGTIILIIGGQLIVKFLTTELELISGWYQFLLTSFKWIIVVLLYFTMISFIYHYGPATHRKWKFITPGSSLATVLSILSTLIFGYFVNNFGTYNQVYGSLGALIVFMLLMNINALVLLVGFELNNSIDMNKNLLEEEPEDDED